jgi:asparaginyl-tRNA synthetase
VEWGCDLQTEHEKYLTDEYFGKPLFVVDYPADIKAFYMKQNPDGKTVAATDLLVPGIGEIIGCSEREADMEKLKAAMLKRGMPLEAYGEYLDTRKYGTVPHSGFGLGFERALMYVTGVQNIRDTLMFPRTVGSL